MAKQSYYDLLRHPLWQKKRLEIMERAGFECERCGAEDTTLNIHHGYYEKGCKPWEYPDESLHCLCETCHEREQHLLATVHKEIGLLTSENLQRVLGYIQAIRMREKFGNDIDYPSPSWSEGFGDFFWINHVKILGLMEIGNLSYKLLRSISQRMCHAS